jgi:hypothetical protein
MTIEDFWNQAFLAALGRLPATQAKKEADTATKLCVEHWQSNATTWAPPTLRRWQAQDVCHVPLSHDERVKVQKKLLGAKRKKIIGRVSTSSR